MYRITSKIENMKNGITRNDLNIGIRHENIISVQITNGKITKENIQELEEVIKILNNNYEHINIILLLAGTLGLTLSANVEALRLFFKTKDVIKKIAIVSDKKWIEFGTKVENFVTPWKEEYFPSTELDDAWEWVKSNK